MKSSLNQLSGDCTDTGSWAHGVMPAAYASPYSPHTPPSSLQLTLRASKANVFRSFPASVDFLFFFFFCFSLKFTHYRINTYVYARSSWPHYVASTLLPPLLCSLANFCQLTDAQSHVHRPCVCRRFLACAARVSISRCFLWVYGRRWQEQSATAVGQ